MITRLIGTIIRVPADPTTSLFASEEEYAALMESFMFGEAQKALVVRPGQIALFIDKKGLTGDVLAVGIVLERSEAEQLPDENLIPLTVRGKRCTLLSELDAYEFKSVGRIDFVIPSPPSS